MPFRIVQGTTFVARNATPKKTAIEITRVQQSSTLSGTSSPLSKCKLPSKSAKLTSVLAQDVTDGPQKTSSNPPLFRLAVHHHLKEQKKMLAMTLSSDEQKVSLSSDEQKVSLSSDEQEVSLSSDEQKASLSSDKQEASLSNDKQEASLSSDEQEASLSSDKQKASLSSDKQKASLDHIGRLVVIGDSLSDSEGRMKSKTCGIMLSSKQYYDGRFTNGFVWPEFLSSPAYLKKKLKNCAEGGAVAAKYSKLSPTFCFISNMEHQIKKHRLQSNDLVIISLGSNDYMTFDKKDVQKVVRCHEKQITKLIKDKKIKNILVTGIPDFSRTAYAHKQDDEYRQANHALTEMHNTMLSSKISELAERYKAEEVNIQFFDFNSHFNTLLSEAEEVNYDTHTANRTGYVDIFGTSEAFDPSHEHVFHDEVHPSQEVHQMLASLMSDFITDKFAKAPHTEMVIDSEVGLHTETALNMGATLLPSEV